MSIDWITVSAQIINFLILVWLLKHFLYQPVLRAMDAREQRVTQRLKDADQREKIAAQQTEKLLRQQAELEKNRQSALKLAQQEADTIKHDLLNEARDEIAEYRQSWQQQAESEKNIFLESLKQRSAHSVISVARKALSDLADTELESQMINSFIGKFEQLNETDIARLQSEQGSVEVVTSFALQKSQQAILTEAIKQQLLIDTPPQFKTAPELGLGIQLNIAEQRIGWNLVSYFDDLGKQFDSALTSGKSG